MPELRSLHLRKKQCEKCLLVKPVFDFYKEKDRFCVDCTDGFVKERMAEAARKRRIKDGEVFRLRSLKYLTFIRGKPCLQCGSPGEAHHIQYAQPRAISRKTGDQYAVPICHPCHMKLHNDGMPERTWWAFRGIDPVKWAEQTYDKWSADNADL